MYGWFLGIASSEQGDLRISGPPSRQGADGRARTRKNRIPECLRVESLSTLPPMPLADLRKFISGVFPKTQRRCRQHSNPRPIESSPPPMRPLMLGLKSV
ncbi:hypothetical protein PoB_002036800 [Plakobranchus ocellatus]|uniref:Uncharacterized protein n=1 Tax=Plakobranchus ocellatus TaxID=259542 RepID=A0AAV3ZHB8_9GAST|nr:hypothetical protein PoB_002036800 [Plakobranchus ocellatus]